jgi:hypothetical protein
MKKSQLFGLFFLLFFSGSCFDNKNSEETIPIQDQTPQILDDNKAEISSARGRYDSDIIEKLFNQAITKDPELKTLTNDIDKMDELSVDSLKHYQDYIQNNEMYFNSAEKYISMIGDSTLKRDMESIYKTLEEQYQYRISNHKNLGETLEKKVRILKDYEIVMELSVTIPMICNYQKNELPDIKGLKNLVGMYDTIIDRTRSYTQTIK